MIIEDNTHNARGNNPGEDFVRFIQNNDNLSHLDKMWFDSLEKETQDLLARYKLSELSKIEQSDVIIKVAPKISDFLAKQFDMQAVLRERAKLFNKDNDLAKFKKMIVVGKVKSYAKRWNDLASWDSLNEIITQKLNANEFSEYEFAQYNITSRR